MQAHGHKEQKESASLIPLIVKKERELETALEQAEARARNILAKAQNDSKHILEEARTKAAAEAETLLVRGEKEIEQEVNRILAAGKEEAQKLKASLSSKITEAAAVVSEFILPNGKSS
ncbi:MAG: hypothetical protein HY587_01290 [Candidatus Omnitrophica bacterium]|nr:hypothetical protein [Candidatus Omnitrophota bacterium]